MKGHKLTRKQQLYLFLEEHNFNPSDYDLEEFVHTSPWVRVKGLGTKGQTLINLSESTGWIDPKSWAINYRSNMIQRLEQVLKEIQGIIPPDEMEFHLNASDYSIIASNYLFNDNDTMKRLKEAFKVLTENFERHDANMERLQTLRYLLAAVYCMPGTPEHDSLWQAINSYRLIYDNIDAINPGDLD